MSAADPVWVQPILLPLDAKRWPLVDAVTAVATASARSLAHADRTAPEWEAWIGGSFRKSVRVAKSRMDFDEAIACAEAVSESRGVLAAGFAPTRYEDMPRWMYRARVEGLHCADNALPTVPSVAEWDIGIVAEMSAGKAAAQVAHAVCSIVLKTGAVPTFGLYQAAADATGTVEIVDAGVTEFAGVPTLTVVASRRPDHG